MLKAPHLIAPLTLLIGCAAPLTLAPPNGFVQPLGKSHPLAGRIYNVSTHELVDRSELDDAVQSSEFLVLGETHDNLDHHWLEATLVGTFLDAHPGAAVGFEMLDEDVRTVVTTPPRDPNAFAKAVQWDESGWPEFAQYRPVFEVVLHRNARIIAAHPSGQHVRESMGNIPEAETHALKLNVPLTAAARTELRDEIREAHCGHAPEPMLDAMERAQSYKDAFMARSIFEARTPAALVTGAGHARNDRAVPHFLRLRGATKVTSVAFLGVEDGRTSPDAYDVKAYDYVVFTPRVSDEDPCERFKESLRKMQEAHGAAQGEQGATSTDATHAPTSGDPPPDATQAPTEGKSAN
jgi:uncharacterized iron-regulated protein